MPLISIITPVYNSAKFIQQCIDNVQQQQFSDFEHIIVDGKSSDVTLDIVTKAASQHKNIRWISEKDAGIYDAMNKGITLATGEWLFFLGCDDSFFDASVLETMSPYLFVNDSGLKIVYGNVLFQKLGKIYDGSFDIEKILTHNVCHQSVFYSKSLFDTFGFYDLKYRIQADYHFNLRCWLSKNVKCLYIPVTVALYADGGTSSETLDSQLTADYPVFIADTVLNSGWSNFQKIRILSQVFRKISLRYPSAVLFNQFKTADFFFLKITALLCMLFVMPVRMINKVIKGSKNP